MIIKNCPAIKEITTLLTSEPPQVQNEWRCCTTGSNLKKCENINDCLLKKIVELAKGYKDELIDRKTKKVVATRYFKLTKEILDLLDIEECE